MGDGFIFGAVSGFMVGMVVAGIATRKQWDKAAEAWERATECFNQAREELRKAQDERRLRGY